jgi:uncharacterized protein (TIGR00290 family)
MPANASPRGRVEPKKEPALLSWSTGKDSAYALEVVRADGPFEIVGLLTTASPSRGRVSVHGVRRELLELQAKSLGLPLTTVDLPSPCPNEEYERAMARALAPAWAEGIRTIVFGDLFLEPIRSYRERFLARIDMRAAFPLWGRDTIQLAAEMLERGIRARLSCIDPRRLDRSFVGREFDAGLLSSLPPGVDPCGENGEFHTFVTNAPSFERPLSIRVGPSFEDGTNLLADLTAL